MWIRERAKSFSTKDRSPKGTNNLGEFLAIVHGLAYLKKKGSKQTIYTDSVTALSWIRKKEVSTNLVRDASTEEIWTLVDRALKWLQTNTYTNKIVSGIRENGAKSRLILAGSKRMSNIQAENIEKLHNILTKVPSNANIQ